MGSAENVPGLLTAHWGYCIRQIPQATAKMKLHQASPSSHCCSSVKSK